MRVLVRDKGKLIFVIEIIAIFLCLLTFLIPLSHFEYSGKEIETAGGIFMEGFEGCAEPGFYIDNSMEKSVYNIESLYCGD